MKNEKDEKRRTDHRCVYMRMYRIRVAQHSTQLGAALRNLCGSKCGLWCVGWHYGRGVGLWGVRDQRRATTNNTVRNSVQQ